MSRLKSYLRDLFFIFKQRKFIFKLFSFCEIFGRFPVGVAYKSVAYKKTVYLVNSQTFSYFLQIWNINSSVTTYILSIV